MKNYGIFYRVFLAYNASARDFRALKTRTTVFDKHIFVYFRIAHDITDFHIVFVYRFAYSVSSSPATMLFALIKRFNRHRDYCKNQRT